MVFVGFGKARYVLVRLLAFFAVIYSGDLRVIAEDKEPVVYQEEPRVGGGTGESEEAGLSSECGACAKMHSPTKLTNNPEKDRDRVLGILDEQGAGAEGPPAPGKGSSPSTR